MAHRPSISVQVFSRWGPPAATIVSLVFAAALLLWTIGAIRDAFSYALTDSVETEARATFPTIDLEGLQRLAPRLGAKAPAHDEGSGVVAETQEEADTRTTPEENTAP